MKITFVMPFASVTGGNRVIAIYARLFKEKGHSVTVISQPPSPPQGKKAFLKKLLGYLWIPPITLSLFDELGQSHKVAKTFGKLSDSEVPNGDAVIATWCGTAEWVANLPNKKGQKFYFLQGYEVWPPLPADRTITSYSLGLKMIAVSKYIRDIISTNHGIGNIEVIPNAVDVEMFTNNSRKKGKKLRVGFVHSNNTIKNSTLAIDALTKVRRRIQNVEVLSFGGSVPSENLPDWIEFSHMPDQLSIPALYRSCDIWLFTSHHEGFGLPILEAMACGTPVLATYAGAAPDLIDGKNGTLLATDAEAFVQEIVRYAEMSDVDWKHHSDAARATAERYSWNMAADRFLEVLHAE